MEQLDRFDHLVRVNQETRELFIYRVSSNGQLSLFTKAPLPMAKGWTEEFSSFARTLGENLLVDSPAARDLLGLDDDG